MLVPLPVEPVRKSRFSTKLFLRQASIEARWLAAADDSTLDGVSEARKSLKPSATVRGMRFNPSEWTELSFYQCVARLNYIVSDPERRKGQKLEKEAQG
jgi:hypothetical protein